MASSITHLSMAFLFLLVLAISSLHADARPSQAARRATRESVGSAAPVVVPEESPAVQVEKAAKFTTQFPTTTTSTKRHGYDYNNNWGGGYKGSEEYPGEEENSYFTAAESSGSKEFSNTVYRPNYGKRKEQHGMSDTRFLENGKYFYDAMNEQGYGFYAGIGVEGGNRGYETSSGEDGESESKDKYEP